MDPLIEALAAPRPADTNKSRMDIWVDGLPEIRRRSVLSAAANPDWAHAPLLALLVENGAPDVSRTSFRDWRMKKGLPRVS